LRAQIISPRRRYQSKTGKIQLIKKIRIFALLCFLAIVKLAAKKRSVLSHDAGRSHQDIAEQRAPCQRIGCTIMSEFSRCSGNIKADRKDS
jgi:hypothetical protein